MKRLMLIFFGLSSSMYGCFAAAAAQPSIGQVISAQGQVVATDQANRQRPLQRHTTIYLHDRIVTQQDSKAQLRLQDDSVIVVQPASEFYVSEFTFSKSAPDKSKYVGNIVKGALINISGQGETKNYKLNSPLTTIAFRGTGLATKLISSGTVLTNQEVYVFQGYVAVSNRCENVVGPCASTSVNIGAGQQANSATVSRAGEIQAVQSSGLLEGCGGGLEKTVVTPGVSERRGGKLVVRCR